MPETRTSCRICESACGLIATVRDGRVTALRPDRDHPVSQGFACRKGTRFADVHYSPRRVLHPMVAGERATWDRALAVVGDGLRTVLRDHGPEAVGLYSGNALGPSLGAVLGASALQGALGTTKHYSAVTLDNAGQFAVLEACVGNPMVTFLADYAGSDCVVLFGTDPLSSQPSQAQSHPVGVRELRDAAGRGQLHVVDPRRSATARRARLHLTPRVGSDIALLAFLVSAAVDAGAEPQLAGAVARFTLAETAAWTGVDPAALADLRDRLLRAERPLVWSGLGVLLGPHGTLGYWLTLALQACLGGIGRAGGWLHHPGAVDLPRLAARAGVRGYDRRLRSRIGGFPAVLGTVASATLADDILEPGPDRLRALIVAGGNPAVSLPDTTRALAALDALDLLVVVDLFPSATARRAHVVLPACSWLARQDVPVHTAQQRRLPHLGVDEAVVAPRGEARDDWAIFTDLARAVGRPAFGSRVADLAVRALGPRGVARLAVAWAGAVRWRDVVAGGAMASTPPRIPRVVLAVPEFLSALDEVRAPSGGIRLITSVRPIQTMNSWIGREAVAARMHPDLAAGAGEVRLVPEGGGAPLVVPVVEDPDLARDVVVLPYGDGDRNANCLIGTDALDVFTGQPVSNGRRVRVEPMG